MAPRLTAEVNANNGCDLPDGRGKRALLVIVARIMTWPKAVVSG